MNNPPSRLRFLRNWISLVGFLVATASFIAFALLLCVDLFFHHGNPYTGIFAYMVAPTCVFLGIGLVVAGFLLELRQEHRAKPGALAAMMAINLSRDRDRKVLAVFGIVSVGLLFLTALGGVRAYNYTESEEFCGQACHTSMEPQHVTSLKSPHSKVECASCHVGPGAEACVRTKINGLRQLYHTVCNNVERPILLKDSDHPPAQKICEQCHSPLKYSPPLDLTLRHFLPDEQNTPFSVRLQLNIGGGDPANGPVSGIHWHMNPANKIEFVSPDYTKTTIPWIRVTSAKGVVTEFRSPNFKEEPAKYPIRTMNCMDCHNRPAHQFQTPNDSVDQALANGLLDPKIPNLKAKVVEALTAPYADKPEALKKIDAFLRDAYPDRPDVGAIVARAQAIYSSNFFPEMKVDWRVHPDQNGHKDSNGCFRCHDSLHKASDGKTKMKGSDCNSCHVILSQGNDEELLKLNAKGHDFFHVDSEYANFSCAKCHTGAAPRD